MFFPVKIIYILTIWICLHSITVQTLNLKRSDRTVDSSKHLAFIPKNTGMADPDVEKWVNDKVSSHKVVIFSKTICPYCSKAIDAVKSLNPKDFVVEQLDNNPNVDKIQDYLLKLTGARTVPRVFIGGQFFGDSSFTVNAKNSGKLQERLKEVGCL